MFDEKTFGFTRNEIWDRLNENGILARKYFYPLTSSFECFDKKYNPSDTPIAQHIANRVLTLPLYADLTCEQVDKICDVILSFEQ